MELETAGAETPAADESTSAPVENAEATTAQPSDTETPDASGETDTGDDAAAKPNKRKHWAHERIDDLTGRWREAQRQAEYWKARAEQTVDVESLDYEEGLAERVSQGLRKEQADTAKATAEQLAAEVFSYRETVAREKYADYDVVARNPNLPVTPSMAEIIRESDAGPDIAYHLGKNPAEAARIASLPNHRQAVELGKLEARITAARPLPKQPPAPVQPVNAMAAGGKSPENMSPAEMARHLGYG